MSQDWGYNHGVSGSSILLHVSICLNLLHEINK